MRTKSVVIPRQPDARQRPISVSLSGDGAVREGNDEFFAITGLDRPDAGTVSIVDITHPWDIPVVAESLDTLVADRCSLIWESRVVDVRGEVHVVSWAASITDDEAIEVRGRDISTERPNRSDGEDPASWLRESLLIANAGAWRYNVTTDHIDRDSTFDVLFHLTDSTPVTTWADLAELIHADDRALFLDARNQLVHSGEVSGDFRLHRQVEETQHVSIRLRVTDVDTVSGIQLAVGAAWNVSATKELEARLYDAAMHDQLTGLANRRAFELAVRREWARCSRQHSQLAFVMVDVDDFKLINDKYGHERGDTALVQFARIVSASVKRPTDVVARYGGEEIVVLLPDTDSRGALAVATTIVRNCREQSKMPPFTVSAGSASSIETDDSPWAVLRRADHACMETKLWGKNHAQPAETE